MRELTFDDALAIRDTIRLLPQGLTVELAEALAQRFGTTCRQIYRVNEELLDRPDEGEPDA